MAGVQTRRAGMMLRRAAWAAVAGWSARNHAVAAASIRGVQSSLLIAIATRRYGRHKGGLPFAPTTRLPGASIASPPLRNDAADNRWPGYLERSFECPRVMGPGHRPGVGRYPDSERTLAAVICLALSDRSEYAQSRQALTVRAPADGRSHLSFAGCAWRSEPRDPQVRLGKARPGRDPTTAARRGSQRRRVQPDVQRGASHARYG